MYSTAYMYSDINNVSDKSLPFLTGHGDYAYQQSSYTEQSYDRSFDDSTQHYYEGGRKISGIFVTQSSSPLKY